MFGRPPDCLTDAGARMGNLNEWWVKNMSCMYEWNESKCECVCKYEYANPKSLPSCLTGELLYNVYKK